MGSHGIEPFSPLDVVADGCLQRFRVVGDKPGSRNGWLVVHADPTVAIFGSWRLGSSHIWTPKRDTPCSPAERAAVRERLRAAQVARALTLEQGQARAAERARVLWERGTPAPAAHPYLARKRIQPHGVRLMGDRLLIPLRDAHGKLWSLQFIAPDSEKLFLPGGRTRGCYFAIGGAVSDTLLVAEGLATAATLHEATGWPVAVAFNANNLRPVAEALRGKFPAARIVITGDNDVATPGNPGVLRATEAARAVGGRVVYPRFAEVHHG